MIVIRRVDTAINIVQKFIASPAGMLLASSPALLLAPEGAAIGAVYLLIIALSEGGAVMIRFTARSTYEALKSLFSGEKKDDDASEWVMVPSPGPPAEFILLPGGVEFAVALNELTAAAEPAPAPVDIAQSVLFDNKR